MKKEFTEIEKRELTNKIFLNIFKEDGISQEVLVEAICESYNAEGNDYKTIDDIPMEEKIEAVTDTCEASGLKFDNYEDILNYFYHELNK